METNVLFPVSSRQRSKESEEEKKGRINEKVNIEKQSRYVRNAVGGGADNPQLPLICFLIYQSEPKQGKNDQEKKTK